MANLTHENEAVKPDRGSAPGHRSEESARAPARERVFGPAQLLLLQRVAGNAAVADLIAGQSSAIAIEPAVALPAVEAPAPPVATPPPFPPPPASPPSAGGDNHQSRPAVQRGVGTPTPTKPPAAAAARGAAGQRRREAVFAVDEWIEPPAGDAASLAQLGGRLSHARALASYRAPVFVVTSDLAVYESDGSTLLGRFPLTATVPLPVGIYLSDTKETVRLGRRKGKVVFVDVAPDKSVADHFEVEQWAKIPVEELKNWYKGRRGVIGVFLVGGALPATETPSGPTPEWEYKGGTKVKGPLLPALPAELQGLDKQPIGGTGTYKMAMDWTMAGPALLDWVAEAASPAQYRWELYNLSKTAPMERSDKAEQLKQTGALPQGGSAEGRPVGRLEGSKRDFARTQEDLDTREARYRADQAKAAAEGRTSDVVANAVNIALHQEGIDTVAEHSKNLINLLADAWGVAFEQNLAWTDGPGTYMIRCVAQIRPGAPESEMRRAATVAVKVVQVMPTETIAEQTLNKGEDDVADLEKRLEDETKAAAAQHRPPRTEFLQQQLGEERVKQFGTAVQVIQQSLKAKQSELDQARQRFPWDDPVYGGDNSFVRPIARELALLKKQLQLAQLRDQQFAAAGAKPGEIIRVRAAIASRVDGQTYPLLLEMSVPKKHPDDGALHCIVSDITSKDTGKYEGKGQTEVQAAQNAMDQLAGHADYGEGALAARLPAQGPFAGMPEETRTLRSTLAARDWKAAKKSLNDLAAILVLIGLLVPGVGEVAAVLAGVLAAERLIERYQNDTLELDAAAVGDILGVLAAFATGVNVVGRLSITKVGTRYVIALSEEGGTVARAAEEAGRWIGHANMIYADVSVIQEFMQIEDDVINGRCTATEGRRRRAKALADAVQAGLFTVEGIKGEGKRAERGPRTPVPTEKETTPKRETGTSETDKTTTTEPPEPQAAEPEKSTVLEPKAGTAAPTSPARQTIPEPKLALDQFRESLTAKSPDSVARAEELIKSLGDWKGALNDAVKKLPGLQPEADAALAAARRAIVDRVVAEVQAAHPDVRAIDVGTPARTSDIDLNWKPQEAMPGFEGKPRAQADQFRDAARASEMFLDKLRAELGGRETDVALDVNSYYFLAEPHVTAGEKAPAVSQVETEMSLAEQRRGMSAEDWANFRSSLLEPLEPKAGKPEYEGQDTTAMDAENKRIYDKLSADLDAAERRVEDLEAQVERTKARVRRMHPMEPENVVTRMARDRMLKVRNRQLEKALSAKPPNPVEVARLQHEIRWLFPDAYVGQPGVDAAVRYNQEWRAAGTERAKARGEERTSADVWADMGPTWAEAKERTVQELAAAASGNVAKLSEHLGHGSAADQLKAALKYAARILNIFEASGLRASGDPVVRKGLADFIQSRWDIWSPEEKGIPKQLVLDWVAGFAQEGEITRGEKGEVRSVDPNAQLRAIDALSSWATDATGQLWRIAAAKEPATPTPAGGKAEPAGGPPPELPKASAGGGPEPVKVPAAGEPAPIAAQDPARLAELKAIRLRYLEGIRALDITENEMRAQRRTTEQIARQLVADRNALKVETRALMKPEEVAQLEARNLKKYGDPVGPTPEYLYDKYGSWDRVIEAAKRTDPETNKLLGVE